MRNSTTPGENGALEHSDAGSPLVALFFKLVRSLPDDSLASLTAAVPAEPASLADLTVLAFQTRATRGMGKGEKDLFFKMLAALPVEAALRVHSHDHRLMLQRRLRVPLFPPPPPGHDEMGDSLQNTGEHVTRHDAGNHVLCRMCVRTYGEASVLLDKRRMQQSGR